MANYIEYQLDDEMTILVETTEKSKPEEGLVKVSRDKSGNTISVAEKAFEKAFRGVKASARVIHQQLSELEANEVEVTFGIKTIGEAGFFAVCNLKMEANYQVTLKWSENRKNQ